MLGLLKSELDWRWAAYGKHPVSRDYFQCGSDFPLMKYFSVWVEKGYTMQTSKNRTSHKACSWRFWAKGSRKGMLVCGLVKDSSDKLGRPYPLLIMGTGSLKNWEEQWEFLPFACENTWNQIEYLSAQTHGDLKKMEAEVQNIRSPVTDWPDSKAKRESATELINHYMRTYPHNIKRIERVTSELPKKTEFILCLDNKLFYNQTMLIHYWHFLLKEQLDAAPNAIFMGGTMEQAYLALLRRPLTQDDFPKFWSVSFSESSGIVSV